MLWLKPKYCQEGEEKGCLIQVSKEEFSLSLGNKSIHVPIEGIISLIFRPEECGKVALQMLGKRLITKQSGPDGKPCDKVDYR